MEYQFICLKPLIRCRCLTAYLKQMFPALLVLNSIFAWSSLSLIRSVDLAWAPAKRRALRFLFPQPEKNFTTFFPASLVSSAASATSLHHFPGYYGKSQTELKFCSPSTWTPPLFRRRSPRGKPSGMPCLDLFRLVNPETYEHNWVFFWSNWRRFKPRPRECFCFLFWAIVWAGQGRALQYDIANVILIK